MPHPMHLSFSVGPAQKSHSVMPGRSSVFWNCGCRVGDRELSVGWYLPELARAPGVARVVSKTVAEPPPEASAPQAPS